MRLIRAWPKLYMNARYYIKDKSYHYLLHENVEASICPHTFGNLRQTTSICVFPSPIPYSDFVLHCYTNQSHHGLLSSLPSVRRFRALFPSGIVCGSLLFSIPSLLITFTAYNGDFFVENKRPHAYPPASYCFFHGHLPLISTDGDN